MSQADILRIAASAEAGSEHPLGEAIIERARQEGIDLYRAEDFQAIPGHGIEVRIEGKRVVLGNKKLMLDQAIGLDLETDSNRLA